MSNKIPKIHIDVINAYRRIEGKRITGKSYTQIAQGLDLDYRTDYVMSITTLLIRKGYLEREVMVDGSVVHHITRDGLRLIGVNPDDSNTSVAVDINQVNETPKKQIEYTEDDKEKAILSLLNETLLKTVVYCKDLSDQLTPKQDYEKIKQVEEEKNALQAKLKTAKLLEEAYERDINRYRDSIPALMGQLKCAIDSKLDEFFEMIPWQRELAKKEVHKDILNLIDETLQDLQNAWDVEED